MFRERSYASYKFNDSFRAICNSYMPAQSVRP